MFEKDMGPIHAIRHVSSGLPLALALSGLIGLLSIAGLVVLFTPAEVL